MHAVRELEERVGRSQESRLGSCLDAMAEALRGPVRLPAGQRLHELIIELDARVEIAHADPLILAVGAPVSLLEESARDSEGWNPRGTQESASVMPVSMP